MLEWPAPPPASTSTCSSRPGCSPRNAKARHRYLRLADPQTAQLVEDLAATVGTRPAILAARAARAAGQLAAARTCYDYLAGVLGVSLFDALVDAELINTRNGLALTSSGRVWFADLAGAGALRPCGTRPLVRTCLDWTERRSHLGGSLGAALCHQLLERAWITRSAQHRGVTVTPTGAQALADRLNLDLQALREQPSAVASGTDYVP